MCGLENETGKLKFDAPLKTELATSRVLEVCRPKTDKMTFVLQFLLSVFSSDPLQTSDSLAGEPNKTELA